jgi:hypothetical protein
LRLDDRTGAARAVGDGERGSDWKLRGLLYWLWVFATTTTTVYRICRLKGSDAGPPRPPSSGGCARTTARPAKMSVTLTTTIDRTER